MAVIKVTELARERGAERSQAERTAARSWHVYTDTKDDGAIIAENAVGVAINSGHPEDSTRKLRKLATSAVDESHTLWLVKGDYSSVQPQQDFVVDPLTKDPVISGDFDTYRVPMYTDKDGNAIANSAGQTFDPPIDDDIFDFALNYERPESLTTFTAAKCIQYLNAVASDSFYGAKPGEAKIVGIRYQLVRESGIRYYMVSYRIAFRQNFVDGTGTERSGWTKLVLDEGLACLSTAPAENIEDFFEARTTAIVDVSTGKPVNRPVKLDGTGSPIKYGTAPTPTYPFVISPDKASVFRHIPPRKVLAFAPLGFVFPTA